MVNKENGEARLILRVRNKIFRRPAAGMWLTPEEPLPSAASTACPADLISSLSLWTPLNVEQMHGRKDLDQPSLTLNVVGISRRALELPKVPSSLELKM